MRQQPGSQASNLLLWQSLPVSPGVADPSPVREHPVIPIKSSSSSGLSVLRRLLPLSRLWTLLAALFRFSLFSARSRASSASAFAFSSFSCTVRGEACEYRNALVHLTAIGLTTLYQATGANTYKLCHSAPAFGWAEHRLVAREI